MKALLAVAMLAGPATAQTVATEAVSDGAPHIAVEPTPRRMHPPGGIGATFGAGPAWQADHTAWMLRLDYDVFPVMAPNGDVGPILGFQPGLEYWRVDHDDGGVDQGFGMPMLFVFGIRTPIARAMLGTGVEMLTIDSIATDAGVGWFSPIGMASVSLDVWGLRLGADARVVRHINIGADDFTQFQLVFGVGWTTATKPRPARPYY